MKKLLIVESPAKIKTISKFLPKEFKIMSTVGHIKDLPSKELGITIDKTIELDYVVLDKKQKVISDICKEARSADEIFLAPDPDREGEIIAWHIAQEIEKIAKKGAKLNRIAFNEITKPAILEAIAHPSSIDLKKVAAQQARRVLDRWVGYEVSPILWRKLSKGLSAGRVQSVALKLICQREEEIQQFKPVEYWSLNAQFLHGNDATITAPLIAIGKKKAEIKNEKEAKDLVQKIKQETFSIDSIIDKKRLKNASAPFMTSTLQQAAYNALGFSVKKTMQIAQKLYEGIPLEDAQKPVALITYMRTDSLRISETAIKQAREYAYNAFGCPYVPQQPNVFAKNKGGKVQDAHEAIRPIDVNIEPSYVQKYAPSDVARLYELIWKRFVACQMNPAEFAQRQVTIQGGQFTFRVTGSTLIFDGFLRVYADTEDQEEESVILPKDLNEKDPLKTKTVTPKQHFTQAPPRYTEASLVKELEKEGIGRPSTYATILTTIQAREYTALEKKKFKPTELGMAVTKMLNTNLPAIMDTKFTANMEEDLDKIASGDIERDTVLRSFWDPFQKSLEIFRGEAKRPTEQTNIACPTCNAHNLIVRFGKSGPFLGCPGYPECSFTSNFSRGEQGEITLIETKTPQLLEQICPNCGKQMRMMNGRFGPFIACSGYPDCKYIHQEKASFKCLLDGSGTVVKRTWRGSVFWGCSNYPKCRFSIKGDIEDAPCPSCKHLYLLKKIDGEKITLSCPNKECGYNAEK